MHYIYARSTTTCSLGPYSSATCSSGTCSSKRSYLAALDPLASFTISPDSLPVKFITSSRPFAILNFLADLEDSSYDLFSFSLER